MPRVLGADEVRESRHPTAAQRAYIARQQRDAAAAQQILRRAAGRVAPPL